MTQAAGYTIHGPLQLMLDHGADPNSRDLIGNTALIYAAARADLPMVQLLLRRGARVELRDRGRPWLRSTSLYVMDTGHGLRARVAPPLRTHGRR